MKYHIQLLTHVNHMAIYIRERYNPVSSNNAETLEPLISGSFPKVILLLYMENILLYMGNISNHLNLHITESTMLFFLFFCLNRMTLHLSLHNNQQQNLFCLIKRQSKPLQIHSLHTSSSKWNFTTHASEMSDLFFLIH